MIKQILTAVFSMWGRPDVNKAFNSPYDCPNCDVYPPEYYYFYIKDKPIDCTRLDETNNSIYGELPWYLKWTKKKVYPIYGETHHGYEGEIDWEETHYCPYCKKEFSFMNGN